MADLLALAQTLDLRPGPGGSVITPFPRTIELFRPVLGDLFPGLWTRAMVVGLYPSCQIVGHTDPPIDGVRTHLALQTNPGAWCLQDGTWFHLPAGTCAVMDPTVFHGAVNWGDSLRLHLVVDQRH